MGKKQFQLYFILCTQRDKASVIIKCIECYLLTPPPPPSMITFFSYGKVGGAIVITFSNVTKNDHIVLCNIMKNVMSILVGERKNDIFLLRETLLIFWRGSTKSVRTFRT